MSDAQLGFFDTTCIQWAERGYPTDYVLWSGFEHSETVSDQAIVTHLQHRIEASPVLNRRLCFTPRGLDYPYWVYGIDEVEPLVNVSSAKGLTWDECRNRFAELVTVPLDLTVSPLRVDVFRGVTGFPGVDKVDIVAVTMSHALMSGRSTGPFTEYLYAERQTKWGIDGLPAAAVDFQPWRAALRSGRVVGQLTTSVARGIKRKRAGTPAPSQAAVSKWWGADFWGEGARQEIEILAIPVPERGAFSVTEMWVGAIAAALARFHAESGETSIVPVSVPVLVPFEETMGANNVLLAQVEVDGAGDDLRGRTQKIRDDLRERRDRLDTPETAQLTEFAASMPYFAQRAGVMRAPTHPRADVFVSSMVFAPTNELSLAGQRRLGGGPVISPQMAVLGHVLWTFNGVITLQVTAKPREAGAVARYAKVLREEFDRVVAAAAEQPYGR